VRAIDSAGYADVTPAGYAWRVNASALDATITGGPTDPSTSRSATFTFVGTGAGFECSLDGAGFATCTNPQAYSELAYSQHTFAVRARDAAGQTGAAASFTWIIANDAPVAFDQAVTTPGSAPVAINLAASDNDPLTFKVGAPQHGALLGIPPALTYVPDSNFEGADSFTFRVNDGLVDSGVATVTVTDGRLHVYPAQPGVAPNGTVAISATVRPPHAGLAVSFTIESGGGVLSSPSATTDADGMAAVLYTAPAITGVVQIEGTLGASSVRDRATLFVGAGTGAGRIEAAASGVYTVGNLAPNHIQLVKTGAGMPLMGWAEFAGNPCGSAVPDGDIVSPFVDVMVKNVANVDAIVVTLRYTNTADAALHQLYWCNLGVWQAVTGTVTVDTVQRTLVFTITSTTAPAKLQLAGTPLVALNTGQTANEVSAFAAVQLPDRVRLTWQTDSEIDLAGFHLYRSTDAASLGTRITMDPVWSQGPGSIQGYTYSFDDLLLMAANERRVYWLEALHSDGGVERYGPLQVDGSANRLYLPVVTRSP
jgi:hypothetical protein